MSDEPVAADRRRIDQFLSGSPLVTRDHEVVALTGDASTRRYFRVIPSAGSPIVLALHEGPIEFASLPFVAVPDLLSRMPLPVPAILGHSDRLGILALQDLGDVTLQAHLGAGGGQGHAGSIAKPSSSSCACSGAAQNSLQTRASAVPARVRRREADVGARFLRHPFRGRLSPRRPVGRRTNGARREWHAIAGELAGEPRVLCHRDYHSRNLMVHDGGLYVIDFQDARMGPDTYDLASLLRDSYVDIDDAALEGLMALLPVARRRTPTRGEFRRRFDLMAVQRNLKALGTFGNQAGARGNPAYVQYMPRTLAYARRNLATYPRFARLRELLASHVPELA